MKKILKQYIFYCIFAEMSIVLNVLIQIFMEFVLSRLNFSFIHNNIYKNINYLLIIKIGVATILCFLFKFIVDKFFIFEDKTHNIHKNLLKILIYGFFSVFTTLIFWFTEFLFKILFNTNFFEIIGAIIGLIIGYTIKFFLDKKFVFNTKI